MVDDAFKLTIDKLCPAKNKKIEGMVNVADVEIN